ncbi:MAG: hypothetical protein ACM31C_15965 [Acidobacteriota bacterium]
MRLVVLVACVAACGDNTDANVTIVTSAFADPLRELAANIPDGRVVLADAPGGGFTLEVVDDPAIPAEGYRIDRAGARTLEVHGHDVLGAQYGVAAALEHLGFRFRHPFDPYVPVVPREGDDELGVVHAPQTRVRGFHFHTLHPIEPYYALIGGDSAAAHHIIDWAIENRANFVQWPVLDDILEPGRHAEWQAATRELIDYAHARGVRVGVNVQLFGQSSLQHSLTLTDGSMTPIADQIAARLPLVVDGLPFDVYDVSFGEFFDADPQAFLDGVNELARQVHALAPGAELHALIHNGGTQLVTYMGQTMIYYFLVKYADPSIVPDIHTVFFYDLFEDAGGAYQMQDFAPHRQYLIDRMCARQPAAYHPEDAYWYAFDNAVPTFLPIYVRSRHYDLAQLRLAAPPPCGPLDEQLLFSTGWEWGYWLNDVTAMRASYELPDTPGELIADALSPDLSRAAPVIADLADAQHDALIGQRLAPYLAARDALIDAARQLGVISLPDRVTFDDLAGASDDARASFASDVLAPLEAHASALDTIAVRLDGCALPDSRWSRELADGVAVDVARAHFVADLYTATLAHLAGDDASARTARAHAASRLADARTIIHRRHGDLHDRDPRLTSRDANATAYAFGYLYFADQLCYWNRELAQVDAILGNSTAAVPACVF